MRKMQTLVILMLTATAIGSGRPRGTSTVLVRAIKYALCTEGRFARSSVWLTVVELGPLLWMLDSSLGTLGRQTLVRVIRVALLARCELYVHTSHKWGCFVHTPYVRQSRIIRFRVLSGASALETTL